jgi:hypothetical protein
MAEGRKSAAYGNRKNACNVEGMDANIEAEQAREDFTMKMNYENINKKQVRVPLKQGADLIFIYEI